MCAETARVASHENKAYAPVQTHTPSRVRLPVFPLLALVFGIGLPLGICLAAPSLRHRTTGQGIWVGHALEHRCPIIARIDALQRDTDAPVQIEFLFDNRSHDVTHTVDFSTLRCFLYGNTSIAPPSGCSATIPSARSLPPGAGPVRIQYTWPDSSIRKHLARIHAIQLIFDGTAYNIPGRLHTSLKSANDDTRAFLERTGYRQQPSTDSGATSDDARTQDKSP